MISEIFVQITASLGSGEAGLRTQEDLVAGVLGVGAASQQLAAEPAHVLRVIVVETREGLPVAETRTLDRARSRGPSQRAPRSGRPVATRARSLSATT